MRTARRALLAAIVGQEAAKESAEFLDDDQIYADFEQFETVLRKKWREYVGKKKLPVGVTKWVPPTLGENAVVPPEKLNVSSERGSEAPQPAESSLPTANDLPIPEPEPASVPAMIQPVASSQAVPTAATATPPPTTPAPPPHAPAAAPVAQKPMPSPLDSAPPPSSPPMPKSRPTPTFRLRNARQSEPFQESITHEPAALPIRFIELKIPDHLGLTCDLKDGSVVGTPAASGEFQLPLKYRFSDDPPVIERIATIAIYINPDPKLLWKNLPSDRSDPLWKEDEAAQLLCGDERRIIAARKRGRSHAHVGTCCDDDFFIQHLSDLGWYVAIVADGAGSAKLSRHGSRLAVRAAGNHLRQSLAEEGGGKIASAVAALQSAPSEQRETSLRSLHSALYMTVGHAAHRSMKALFDEAQSRPDLIQSVKELSTTLLIGIARKFGSQWLCAAYWVGDGAVGVLRTDGSIELLGEVDSGEYSGQTRFLDANEVNQESLLRRTRFTLCDDFTAFILMTDGVSDPKFETEARLATSEAWGDLWKELETGVALYSQEGNPDMRLLEWLDFWSQGNHDDRTIAIIY